MVSTSTELDDTRSIIGSTRMNSEILDSMVAKGFMKIMNAAIWAQAIFARTFLCAGKAVCVSLLFLLHLLLDVVLHAAQGMDSFGDSQREVPIDPRSQATFSSLGEIRPARGRGYGKRCRWRQPKDLSKSTETRTKPIPHRSRVDPEVAMENAQSKVARLQKGSRGRGRHRRGCRRILAGRVGEGPCSSNVASNRRPDLEVQGFHREVRAASCLVGGRDRDREGGPVREASPFGQIGRGAEVPPTTCSTSTDRSPISKLRLVRDRLVKLVVAESEGRPDPKRVCRREDFMPMCDEEMHEWLEARQRDLHTARASGQHSEVERLSTHGASYARVAAPTDCIVAVHPCAHGDVTFHQCGLNGVQVGEASHADVFLRMILHRTRSLCWHPIGMLSLAFQVPHLLPMQHNWMLNPGSCHRQRVHLPQRRRTQVPIVEGAESAVRVQTLDIDSSDDDAPFTVPRLAPALARPSRRLVLVPESVDATPQSIQDRVDRRACHKTRFSARDHPRRSRRGFGAAISSVVGQWQGQGATIEDKFSPVGEWSTVLNAQPAF